MKKLFKRFLQTFITIEVIPFTENGNPKEFCTMYVFNKRFASAVFTGKDEKDELCEYLGII